MFKNTNTFAYLATVLFTAACNGPAASDPPGGLSSAGADEPSQEGLPDSTGSSEDPGGGDSSQFSCSVDAEDMKHQAFALDATTPLGVPADHIAAWTLEGSGDWSWFNHATAESEEGGSITFAFVPQAAIYASGQAPHDGCSQQELLFIETDVEVQVSGAVYRGEGRVEVRPGGVESGSDEVVTGSGDLMLNVSCTEGCASDAVTGQLSASLADDGTTILSLKIGSQEGSISVP